MRRTGIVVTAVCIALALGAVWCRRGDGSVVHAPPTSTGASTAADQPASTGSPVVASSPTSWGNTSAAAASSSGSGRAPHPAGSPAAPSGARPPLSAPSPSSSARVISEVIAQREPRDLAFLAKLERELKRDPPPEARHLIELRRGGASREQLVAYVREQFPPDLQLRALALRWIDEDRTDAGGAKPGVPATAGSGPALVKPISPR